MVQQRSNTNRGWLVQRARNHQNEVKKKKTSIEFSPLSRPSDSENYFPFFLLSPLVCTTRITEGTRTPSEFYRYVHVRPHNTGA